MEKGGYKPFDSYNGSTPLGSGLIPGNTDYPFLIQSSNVQIDEEGHSLYDLIESGEFGGGGEDIDLSGYQLKTDDSLETESKEIVGAINEINQKTNIDEELTEQDSLIEQIKAALIGKIGGSGTQIPVTPEDEGKFLSVVNGVATWVELPVAEDIVITIAEEIVLNV